MGPFDGGFVGVDVFFVISGYLITSLLLREADRTGRVSLRDFYARRARRILPAATARDRRDAGARRCCSSRRRGAAGGGQAIWATFFAANIKFARDSTDYFAAGHAASPLQHYWSLAVEEQFYLFWPLILLAALLLLRSGSAVPTSRRSWCCSSRPSPPSPGRSTTTEHDPLSAYFSTTARAWELASAPSGPPQCPTSKICGPTRVASRPGRASR